MILGIRDSLRVLAALALAGCGDNARLTDAGAPLDPSGDAAPDPDAAMPCVDPCFATGVFDGAPTSLAVRDGTVYIATQAPDGPHNMNYVGAIKALGPDKQVTTLATDQSAPHFLLVDASTVFWTTLGWFEPSPSIARHEAGIMKVARSGGAPGLVVGQPAASHIDLFRAAVLDGDQLYFADLVADLSVHRVSTSGGAPQQLAVDDNMPASVRVLANALAVHGDTLYWVDGFGGLVAMPKGGGTREYLRPPADAQGGMIAIDDSTIYFVSGRRTGPSQQVVDILKVPLAGGTIAPVVENIGLLSLHTALTVDNGNLYYVGSPDAIARVLFRVPVDGGTPTRIADASAYAVDATHVYWADDRGTVYRMTK
jgi:hypothetical protein